MVHLECSVFEPWMIRWRCSSQWLLLITVRHGARCHLRTLVLCPCAQAGVDVSAMITAWGTWQPALDPNRRPSVSDALIGSLGDSSNGSQVRHVLVAPPWLRPVSGVGCQIMLGPCYHVYVYDGY